MEAGAQQQSIDALISSVQRLSLAETLGDIQEIVRTAARELTGADGATFVLREREFCYYADEDAIQPLWKGQRFPIEECISGWVMLNRTPAVIEDIYIDERIRHEIYQPTFIKSLAMVPIRSLDPIGAIGNYWAQKHWASSQDVSLLQSLADATAVAVENVSLALGSTVDSLTGVWTRRAFFDEAGRRFGDARAEGRQCTVGFADIDGVQSTNERLGHDVGSALIRDAVGLLSEAMGADAVIGRLGGDEFAVYIDEAVEPEELRVRLTAACDQANAARSDVAPVSISFGAVTAWAEAVSTLDRVIAAADQRMYRDKRNRTQHPSSDGAVRGTPRDQA
jgi:diguanylate cyclase (GGDEF)-like protein